MSTRDFLYGFMQGFNQAGGTQKLSSWAGRTIGGGKYYDPYNDPYYLQELTKARQLGTPSAYQGFADTWGDYIDVPEGQTHEQYLFGVEPEPKTFYGMPEENFRSLVLNAAMSGQEVPENVLSGYQKTFGYDISPVVQMFTPEEQGPEFNELMSAYANVRDINTPFARRMFRENFADLIPENVTDELLFPKQDKSVLDLISSGLRQLPPEEVERYRNEGYIVTEIPEYGRGWYAVQEGLPVDKKLTGEELMRRGYLPLSDEMVAGYKEGGYYPVEVPGYEGYYSLAQGPPTEEGKPEFDYGQLGFQELLSLIMLDETVSPKEKEIWEESPWSSFGQPENIWEIISKSMGEEPKETPSINLDDFKYAGRTPDGRTVMQVPTTKAQIAIDNDGNIADWTGQPVVGVEGEQLFDAGAIMRQNLNIPEEVAAIHDGEMLPLLEINRLITAYGFSSNDGLINMLLGGGGGGFNIDESQIKFAGDEEKGPSIWEQLSQLSRWTWPPEGGLGEYVYNLFTGSQQEQAQKKYTASDILNYLKVVTGAQDYSDLADRLQYLTPEGEEMIKSTGWTVEELLQEINSLKG